MVCCLEMDVEARCIVALCHRHLDGKMALRRNTGAHLIEMAARNFVLL